MDITWKYPYPNRNIEDGLNHYGENDVLSITETIELPNLGELYGDKMVYIEDDQKYNTIGEMFLDFHLALNLQGLFDDDGNLGYLNEAQRIVNNYCIVRDYLHLSLGFMELRDVFTKSKDGIKSYKKISNFLKYYQETWDHKRNNDRLRSLLAESENELETLDESRDLIQELLRLYQTEQGEVGYPITEIDLLIDSFGDEYTERRNILKVVSSLTSSEYRINQHVALLADRDSRRLLYNSQDLSNQISNDICTYLSYNPRISKGIIIDNEEKKKLYQLLKKLKRVISTVNSIKKYKNALARYVDNNRGCFALMDIKGARFFAFSGVFDAQEDKILNYMDGAHMYPQRKAATLELMRRLPSLYGNSPINYAYCNLDTLSNRTYKAFLSLNSAIDMALSKDDIAYYYACCERKMLSFLNKYSHGGTGYILVRKKPCKDCWSVIKEYKKRYGINVFYIGKNNKLVQK